MLKDEECSPIKSVAVCMKSTGIWDLARKMGHLMGLTEKTEDMRDGDIEITFTGLPPLPR